MPPLVIAVFISAFVADAFAMYEVYHILQKLLASPADKKREVTREYDFVIHANFFFVFAGVSGTYHYVAPFVSPSLPPRRTHPSRHQCTMFTTSAITLSGYTNNRPAFPDLFQAAAALYLVRESSAGRAEPLTWVSFLQVRCPL